MSVGKRRPGRHPGGYDEFAWLYDRRWGDVSLQFVPVYDRLVLDELPVASRILDLACGTGQLAALLTGRGFRLTGLDSSPGMLDIARRRAPGATFVHADARSFELDDQFDAVVCVYDSLNHIMTLGELREAFGRVAAALVPGGRFAFDLATEEGHPGQWRDSFVADDHVAVVESSVDRSARVVRFEAILFRPSGGSWKRTDVSLVQRYYPEGDVCDALRDAGFVEVGIVRPDDLGLGHHPGRLFFTARIRDHVGRARSDRATFRPE